MDLSLSEKLNIELEHVSNHVKGSLPIISQLNIKINLGLNLGFVNSYSL